MSIEMCAEMRVEINQWNNVNLNNQSEGEQRQHYILSDNPHKRPKLFIM